MSYRFRSTQADRVGPIQTFYPDRTIRLARAVYAPWDGGSAIWECDVRRQSSDQLAAALRKLFADI